LLRKPCSTPWRAAAALLGLIAFAACGGEPARPDPGARPRIVSLVPTATETLFALGAGDVLVGRSTWCDEPEAARALPALGDVRSADAERILLLEPTLVLTGSATQEEMLRGVAPVERVAADSVAGVLRTIRRLGEIADRAEEAERLTGRIEDALENAPDAGGSRRVLLVVGHEPLVVAGPGSYAAELLGALGARNVAGDLGQPWPVLSLESLVARDPDVILDADLDSSRTDEEVLAFWERFPSLSAGKEGRILRISGPAVVRPGPRLPGALEALADALRRCRR